MLNPFFFLIIKSFKLQCLKILNYIPTIFCCTTKAVLSMTVQTFVFQMKTSSHFTEN